MSEYTSNVYSTSSSFSLCVLDLAFHTNLSILLLNLINIFIVMIKIKVSAPKIHFYFLSFTV